MPATDAGDRTDLDSSTGIGILRYFPHAQFPNAVYASSTAIASTIQAVSYADRRAWNGTG